MARNLYQRNGVWIFRKEVDGRDWRVSTGFRDRRAAERRAAEIEVEVRSRGHGWIPRPAVTFGHWARTYNRSYGQTKRSKDRDSQILAHIQPNWQHRPLDAITRSECVTYINRRGHEGAKPATIMREIGLLKAMFNAAIREGLMTQNPWAGIKGLRTEPRTRVLGSREQVALMEALNPEYQRLVVTALGTGLREAELLGLRPRDIDRAAGQVFVRAGTAKGGRPRTVPLLPAVEEALDEQVRHRSCGPDDRLWRQSGSAVWKCLRAAAKRAKLEPLCVHDLRRTFGTRCAVSGMPLPQLQKIMGHASPEVTMRHYVQVGENDLRRALAQIDLGLKPSEVGTKVVTFSQRTA
jgi:integrase